MFQMCPRTNPDGRSLSWSADPGPHSCHLGTMSASGRAQLVMLQQWEKEYILSLHLPIRKGTSPGGTSAKTGSPSHAYSPLPSLGSHTAPWVGAHNGFQDQEHTLAQTSTRPPIPTVDSLLHEEGESSPKSPIIPRCPTSSVHQAHVTCQAQLQRGFSLFSSKPSRPPGSHPLGSNFENQAKIEETDKFYLEVVESRIYLK